MVSRRRLHLLLLAIVTASCSRDDRTAVETDRASDAMGRAREIANALTPAELLEDVKALSSDAFQGRFPGSDGDRMARKYLAQRLGAAGCEPGFDGSSYEQAFDMVGITSRVPERWTFRAADGREVSFRYRDEFMAAGGAKEPEFSMDRAEVVFVGYGIRAPEESWDDFKGADLRGKLLLMLNDDPDWDPELFAGERKLYYGRWTYKLESAARAGAVGAILIHTTPSAGYPWDVVRNSWSGEQFVLPEDGAPRSKLQAWLTEDAAVRLRFLLVARHAIGQVGDLPGGNLLPSERVPQQLQAALLKR